MEYNMTISDTASLGLGIGVIIFSLIICLVVLLFNLIIMMRIFQKAGRPGWAAFIPFYNTWTMLEIVYLPGWLMFLAFIPLVNFAFFIVGIIASYRLPQCYEKSSVWGILNIFFPLVVQAIIAFDRSEYCGYEKG